MAPTDHYDCFLSIFFGNKEVTYRTGYHSQIVSAHDKWIRFGSKFAEVSDNNRRNNYGSEKVWYQTPSGFLRFYPSELYTGYAKNDRAWPIIDLVAHD